MMTGLVGLQAGVESGGGAELGCVIPLKWNSAKLYQFEMNEK